MTPADRQTVSLDYVAITLGIPFSKVLNMKAATGAKFPRACGKDSARRCVYDRAAVDAWIDERWVKTGRGFKRRKRLGFIYFIGCRRYVKIGFTADVAERIANLQTANPHPLTLLATYPVSGQKEETRLHKRFRKYRVRGGGSEWFHLSVEIGEYIASVSPAAAPPGPHHHAT